jgi:N-acetylneuraminate synthase
MTKFIAEICSNHNQDLSRALSLIDKAAEIGAWGVKFQLFRVEKMFHSSILNHPDYQFLKDRIAWELPIEWLPALQEQAHKYDIKFGCTPFDLDAVNILKRYVDFFKIASYELPWTRLLISVAQSGKPVILSTGMATINEIREACKVFQSRRVFEDLTVLHCISEYKVPVHECHLAFLDRIKMITSDIHKIGWSDHSRNPGVIYRAVHKYDCQAIEFHFDLDGGGAEYNMGHCWLPHEIKAVIRTVNEGLASDGGLLEFTPQTAKDRLFRRDPDGFRPMRETRSEL